MNFRRIFANAVARRVAALLVAAALAWLGLGEARAQSYPFCTGTHTGTAQCPDLPTAHSTAMEATMRVCNGYTDPAQCIGLDGHDAWVSGNNRYVQYYFTMRMSANSSPIRQAGPQRYVTGTGCPAGQEFNPYTLQCGTACASRPNSTVADFLPRSGSTRCVNGCEVMYFRNGDGTSTGMHAGPQCSSTDYANNCPAGTYWNAAMWVCEPPEADCPAGQTPNSRGECAPEACPPGMTMGADGTCSAKDSECPAGNVKAPSGECLPGDGQCAAGEARRDNGTCGKDSDGDGKADEDDDNPDNDPDKESASGGDSCNAPPACSGGAIDCMQVKIQWRIDCNTRRNRNVSGGSCAAMPVCTGEKCDALEYASLLQQWRAACHLEKLANATPGEGGTPGGDSGAMDPVGSGGVLGDDLDPSTVQRGAGGGSWDGPPSDLELNEAGYGFVRSCPTLPTISVMGQSLQFDTTVFCDWMRLGGVFVLIMAHLAGLTLVVRSI